MEADLLTVCKNCGNHFKGNYCNNCRQSAKTNRITWKELLNQFLHSLFRFDKGIIYTIKELLIHPGKTIRDYLSGKRVYHYNPFKFLFLVGGLSTLFYLSLNLKLPNEAIELEKIEAVNITLAHKFFAAIGFLFMILLTITDFIFYYKKKYTLPEIIVSNAFQAGQIMVFTIAMLPVILLQNYLIQEHHSLINLRSLQKAISMGFLFFTRYQFYEAKGNYYLKIKIIVQLVAVYILNNQIINYLIELLQS